MVLLYSLFLSRGNSFALEQPPEICFFTARRRLGFRLHHLSAALQPAAQLFQRQPRPRQHLCGLGEFHSSLFRSERLERHTRHPDLCLCRGDGSTYLGAAVRFAF